MIGSDKILAMLAKGKTCIVKNVGDQDIRLVCDLASDLPIDTGSLNLSMCDLGTYHLQVLRLVAEGPRVRKPGGKLGFKDLCTALIWSSSSIKFFTGTIRHR